MRKISITSTEKKLLREAKSKSKSPVLKQGCECILLASYLDLSVRQLAQHSKYNKTMGKRKWVVCILYSLLLSRIECNRNFLEKSKVRMAHFSSLSFFENLKNELINSIENKYQKCNINLV
jgi:hypothetical protein